MKNLSSLDIEIINAIRSGNTNFFRIENYIKTRLDTWQKQDRMFFRRIDRRLQAMRKSGLIAYSRKTGWTMEKSWTILTPPA